MFNYLLVFVGGGAGSVLRLAMSSMVAQKMGTGFPWGTLTVNILGAVVIGVLAEVLALKFSMMPAMRLLLVTGFLGGFTTFSAFSLESALMFQRGDYGVLALYVGMSVVGTIAGVLMATHAMRMVM